MNANPVTQKQLDFINTLKQQNDSKTSFLSGIVPTYERIAEKTGKLPEKVSQGISLFSIKNDSIRVLIPADGELTPADVIEMKIAFDNYIADYTPETTSDASAVIDILKNARAWAANEFIYNWLTQNYSITEVVDGQYTKHLIGNK